MFDPIFDPMLDRLSGFAEALYWCYHLSIFRKNMPQNEAKRPLSEASQGSAENSEIIPQKTMLIRRKVNKKY